MVDLDRLKNEVMVGEVRQEQALTLAVIAVAERLDRVWGELQLIRGTVSKI